jgi:hypothetical protein
MKLFVLATRDDTNMHAKFQIICKHKYLWTINLVSEILEILNQNLPRKSEFSQAHYEEWFKRIHTKFISTFLDIPRSFYEFWKFETISEI